MEVDRVKKELEWRKSRRTKTLGGIDTDDLQGLVDQLDSMVAVNKKLLAAVTEIAQEASPFDGTGEPLQVRIAKDLTRRIEIARAAL